MTKLTKLASYLGLKPTLDQAQMTTAHIIRHELPRASAALQDLTRRTNNLAKAGLSGVLRTAVPRRMSVAQLQREIAALPRDLEQRLEAFKAASGMTRNRVRPDRTGLSGSTLARPETLKAASGRVASKGRTRANGLSAQTLARFDALKGRPSSANSGAPRPSRPAARGLSDETLARFDALKGRPSSANGGAPGPSKPPARELSAETLARLDALKARPLPANGGAPGPSKPPARELSAETLARLDALKARPLPANEGAPGPSEGAMPRETAAAGMPHKPPAPSVGENPARPNARQGQAAKSEPENQEAPNAHEVQAGPNGPENEVSPKVDASLAEPSASPNSAPAPRVPEPHAASSNQTPTAVAATGVSEPAPTAQHETTAATQHEPAPIESPLAGAAENANAASEIDEIKQQLSTLGSQVHQGVDAMSNPLAGEWSRLAQYATLERQMAEMTRIAMQVSQLLNELGKKSSEALVALTKA